MSLKVRFPLYVATAMTLVLVVVALGAYREVRTAQVTAVHERLQRVTGQLAELTTRAQAPRAAEVRALGGDPVIVQMLTDPMADQSAVRERLREELDGLEATGIEIRDQSGLRVVAAGNAAAMPMDHSVDLEAGSGIGALLSANGLVVYAIAAPIRSSDETVGSLYVWREAARLDEEGRRVLGDLIGVDANILLGSLGGAWSDLSSITPPPPLGLAPGEAIAPNELLTYRRGTNGKVFATVVPLPGTAWYLVVELPADEALAGARTLLKRLLLILPVGLLLVALVAFGVGKTVTRSLSETAAGAEAIAAGEKGYRVPVRHDDELGRLARSFNAMAQQIEDSQEALRDLNASLRIMLDGAPLPIIVLDQAHRVRMWNQACETTFGWSAANVVGRPSPLRDLGGDEIVLASGPEGVSGREYRTLREDGQIIDVFIASAPTYSPHGQVDGEILVCEDITARKRAEAQLERYAERLSRSNEELENFAYVASHDLREPLRMVRSFTGLLAERYSGQLDDEAVKYINFAVDGANRMEGLIRALLEYARVDAPSEEAVEVSMEGLVGDVLQLLSPAIAETGAVITHDPLPIVAGDPDQLLRLLQNLIGNGIKFCRDREPRVHISVVQRGDDAVFCVRDNGIGIEEDYFERIFQVFRRLHGLDEFGGTGIGLAICKKIVERHGGRIWLESTPGEGSRFYFSIPGRLARVA